MTTSQNQLEQAKTIESGLMQKKVRVYQDIYSTSRLERELDRYFTNYQNTMSTCSKSDALESIFTPSCLTPFLEVQQILDVQYQQHHEALIDEISEQISAMKQLRSDLESLSTKRQRIYRDCTGDTTTDDYEADVTDSLSSVHSRFFDCISTIDIGSMEIPRYCMEMRQENLKNKLESNCTRRERIYRIL